MGPKEAISEVQPGLWIGSTAALDGKLPANTTHLLTLNGAPPPASLPSPPLSFRTLSIPDDPSSDLLSHFGDLCTFLSSTGPGDAALVLCSQGVSRSAAVAAAFLMREGAATRDEALARLAAARPGVEPNEGFVEQLDVWQQAGGRANPRHRAWRAWRLGRIADSVNGGGASGADGLRPGALDADVFADADGETAGRAPAVVYRCRACRERVATDAVVVESGKGPGARAFWGTSGSFKQGRAKARVAREARERREARQETAADGEPEAEAQTASAPSGASANASSGGLFVEPLRWMRPELESGEASGKLYCPACRARLGSYAWQGMPDATGQWVVPAFQLHLSKLDVVQVGGANDAADAGAKGAPTATSASPSPASVSPGAASASSGAVRVPRFLSGSNPARAAVARPPARRAAASASAAAPAIRTPPADPGPPPAPLSASDPEVRPAPLPPVARDPSRPFDYLLLDCDGVMVDTEPASCESLRMAVRELSGFDVTLGRPFPEAYFDVFGADLKTCWRVYSEKYEQVRKAGTAEDVIGVFAPLKERCYRDLVAGGIPAYAGIRELILEAQRAGMGVAIASSGEPEKIHLNLSSSGLYGLVPDRLTVSAVYVEVGKPSPKVYQEAMRRLGCPDASRALVLEDSTLGLEAAKAAGCFAVGVTNTLPRERLERQADRVVENAAECADVLFGRASATLD